MALSPRSRRFLPLVAVPILVVAALAAVLATFAGSARPSASPRRTNGQAVAGATSTPLGAGSNRASQSGSEAAVSGGGGCSTSTGSGYTIVACVAGPVAGSTVTGPIDVSAKVTTSGQTTGIQRAIYQIDGKPILTAFQTPYKFSLDTAQWPDGQHRLTLLLTTRDGLTTAPATMGLSFNNGVHAAVTTPASAEPFHPTSGTAASGAFVVAAVGDGASGEKGETQTVAQIASWNPNLFLYLGDVYENGRPTEFDNWYGTATSTNLYGRFRSITDPTVGNHEYIGNDAPGYFGYWQGIGHYYSFDAGGWHFVSIDSNPQYAQLQAGTGQYDWLDHDLSSTSAACTVVYFHHPLFNAGPEKEATQMTAVWELMTKHHVTLVLNGHDHDYQRWVPLDPSGQPSASGITEIVVGSGGHGHQPQRTADKRLAASDFKDFGALKLTLAPTSAAFQFVTSAGTVADSGTLKCQGGRADVPGVASGSSVPAGSDASLPDVALLDGRDPVRGRVA